MNSFRPMKKAVRHGRTRVVAGPVHEDSSTDASPVNSDSDRHQLSVPACVQLLASNNTLSDITFVFPINDGQRCPAHKLFLAMRSQVFEAMFYGPMSETSSEIEVTDMDVGSFQVLLQFIYTDKADLTGDTVFQCVFAADKYGVQGLKDKCSDFLANNLNIHNVLTVCEQARFFNMEQLLERCRQHIAVNAELLFDTDGMLELSQNDLEGIVGHPDLRSSEERNFKLVCRWAEYQCKRKNVDPTPENLRSALGEALYKIRIPLMSSQTFDKEVTPTGILSSEENKEMLDFFTTRKTINEGCVGRFSSVPRLRANIEIEFGTPHVISTYSCSYLVFRLSTPLPFQIKSLTLPHHILTFVKSFCLELSVPTYPVQVYDQARETITFHSPLNVPAGQGLEVRMYTKEDDTDGDSEKNGAVDDVNNVKLTTPMTVHIGEIPITFHHIPKDVRSIGIRFATSTLP